MDAATKLCVMRSLDKYDRLGREGVKQLLTTGRQDNSGAFTPGCGLGDDDAELILMAIESSHGSKSNKETLARLKRWFFVMTMTTEQLDQIMPACEAILALEPEEGPHDGH